MQVYSTHNEADMSGTFLHELFSATGECRALNNAKVSSCIFEWQTVPTSMTFAALRIQVFWVRYFSFTDSQPKPVHEVAKRYVQYSRLLCLATALMLAMRRVAYKLITKRLLV